MKIILLSICICFLHTLLHADTVEGTVFIELPEVKESFVIEEGRRKGRTGHKSNSWTNELAFKVSLHESRGLKTIFSKKHFIVNNGDSNTQIEFEYDLPVGKYFISVYPVEKKRSLNPFKQQPSNILKATVSKKALFDFSNPKVNSFTVTIKPDPFLSKRKEWSIVVMNKD